MSAWDNPQEMLTRAQAARALGDRTLAYQMYARASEINPQDAIAWRGRAETCANQDEALVSYAYASALAPTDETLEHTLESSVEKRLSTTVPDDVPLLVEMGQELAEVGLADQAERFFQRAVDLDGNCTDALVWLAGVEQDRDRQIEYLNRALATNPRDSRARAGLLALKPLASPTSGTPDMETMGATTADATTLRTEELVAASQAQAQSSMERLRKLREANPPDRTAPHPAPAHTPLPPPAAAPAPNNTMRYLLLGLLGLVVVLMFAGIFLLLTR